jgi:ATP:cob(I)alamin adenosyltransferase
MKIYTKTGDKGQTGLIGGTRVPKNDVRLEAYGTIDELNSFIGVLTTHKLSQSNLDFLRSIQHKLFAIGSYLATDTSVVALNKASILDDDSILSVEAEIDKLNLELPELNSFILPGGSKSGALAHVCRTVTRRAERRLYDVTAVYDVDNHVIVFLNRLSDYFFVLSRFLTYNSGCEEIFWKKQD